MPILRTLPQSSNSHFDALSIAKQKKTARLLQKLLLSQHKSSRLNVGAYLYLIKLNKEQRYIVLLYE